MDGSLFFTDDVDGVESPRVVICKSARALEVYDGETLVARMRAAIGRSGAGPKTGQGDGRTPEGLYYACTRNDKSKYHLSIGISYPNTEDAKRGLAAGLIGQGEYDGIAEAEAQRVCPPWDTALGGEIMIHGGGSDRDWTAGCIALDNECMEFLWKFIEIGTKVEILP